MTAETDLYARLTAGGRAVGRPGSPVHAEAELLVAENWRMRGLRNTRVRNLGGGGEQRIVGEIDKE